MRQRVHELRGLVHLGVLGDVAAVEVGRERGEAFAGQPVDDALDLRRESPPLLDDEHARVRCPTAATREVALDLVAVARERDGLAHAALRSSAAAATEPIGRTR